jgi:hypothetical protein
LAYQPPASSTFLSEQTSHQQPASSTLLSEQTSTSHQPPANRTGWEFVPYSRQPIQSQSGQSALRIPFPDPDSLVRAGSKPELAMAPLSWRHDTLLQARLTRCPLSECDFNAVFAAVSGRNPVGPIYTLVVYIYIPLLDLSHYFLFNLGLFYWSTFVHRINLLTSGYCTLIRQFNGNFVPSIFQK